MSKKHQVITISPSGNLYGSENVLFDYLSTTELNHIVFVPKNSSFEQKLKSQKWNHRIKSFNPRRLKLFYAYLILFILISRIKSVYVNEGGHYRWIKFLAKLLPSIKYTVHLRMIYDAKIERIGYKIPKNVRLVAISKYVAEALTNFEIKVDIVYDGFKLINQNPTNSKRDKVLKIGIIGRVSTDKGINKFYQLINELELRSLMNQFEFHFYGSNRLANEDLNLFNSFQKQYSNIKFRGFENPDKIYKEIHAVLHFNMEEGLGRVFLESIASGIPFIGYDSAGISEVGKILNQENLLIDPDDNIEKMVNLLIKTSTNYETICQTINLCQKKLNTFDINEYSQRIDTILSKN